MYFNNTNSFFHGIMFHHFHDDEMHTKGQGSVSKDDFYKIIRFIGEIIFWTLIYFLKNLKKIN